MLSQILLRCTCLSSFAFTSLPVHCVSLLTPASFRFQHEKKKFKGQHAFSHLGPVTWNKLPYSVRHAQIQSQFKTQLKTTIFHSVYEPLLELLCVFNCSSYFSSCKTACDLHLCVSEQGERERGRERESANEAQMVWFSAFWCVYFGGM